jgi:hypothetical protein
MPHSAASSLGPAWGLEVGVKGRLRRAAKDAPPALDPGFKPVMPLAPTRFLKEAVFWMRYDIVTVTGAQDYYLYLIWDRWTGKATTSWSNCSNLKPVDQI